MSGCILIESEQRHTALGEHSPSWARRPGPNTRFVLTSREIAGEIASGAKAPPAVSPAVSRAAAQPPHVRPHDRRSTREQLRGGNKS